MSNSDDGMRFEYEINRFGDGDTVLFLHGWGGGLSSFRGAYSALSGMGINCVNYAFPKRVPETWGIYDYARQVAAFTEQIGVSRPIVVGHSFGGRVAVILASQGLCKKLVLTGSAGLKPRSSLRKKLRVAAYHRAVKRGKPLDGFGSIDYNNLEPCMRPVFVRVVNAHLDGLLPYIKCETLLFWGKHDRETPPYMARRFAVGIQDSTLVFANGGHYAYVDSGFQFVNNLKKFIME